ncbi:MAG TPA: hypothetical protein VD995_00530 [Azospirillum sp.]|nr:hypothetical protein [Azospirillum sp.]
MFDVAVVTPTILRPTLLRAARSVFAQDHPGRIQFLIGIDKPLHDPSVLDAVRAECPPHVTLTILDLGYSTSVRHGGFYSNAYGGALRTILSYAADSRYVAYLDDNDWHAGHHLSSLLEAIAGHHWAFSYRWLADPLTERPICRDEWDAVGPGRGINLERYGGFVHPSTLLLDKTACHFVLPQWSLAAFPDGSGEDRRIFQELNASHPGAATGQYSCYTILSEQALRDDHHAREFHRRGLHWMFDRTLCDAADRAFVEMRQAYREGRYDDAVTFGDRILSAVPTHAPALRERARAAWKTGRRDVAIDSIRRAIDVDDTDEAAQAILIRILAEAGDGLQACRTVARARVRFPRSRMLNDLHDRLFTEMDHPFEWPL